MSDQYITDGKFDRTQLALDVKNGKINKDELIIIFDLINKFFPFVGIEDPCIGNSCKTKRKKAEWDERYLDYLVAEVSSSEVFNKESMLYLLEVTEQVKFGAKHHSFFNIFNQNKIKINKETKLENIISGIAEEMQTFKLSYEKALTVIVGISKLTGNVNFTETNRKKGFRWFGYKRKRIKQLEKENAELQAVITDIKKLVEEINIPSVYKLPGEETNAWEYEPKLIEN